MAATTANLVCDQSTLSNFVQWAQAISNFIGTNAGWTKASDAGQVNWSTISAVPGENTFVYEVWEPNDGLTAFFLKVEYGNYNTNSNNPTIRLSIGTSTDGVGNLVGTVLGPFQTTEAINFPSATTQYECRFSGEPGRLSMLMWRDAGDPNDDKTSLFVVERSLNASGTYTGDYVTLCVVQNLTNNHQPVAFQTLHFTFGLAPASSVQNGATSAGLPCRIPRIGELVSANFNGSVPLDLCAPFVGFFDYPLTSIGGGPSANYTDGQIVTTTVYGVTRTYIVCTDFTNTFPGANSTAPGAVLIRWD